MTTSSSIEPEDAPQSTHSNSNGPPPINWATHPSRSLPATPKRPQSAPQGHLYPGTPQTPLRASVDPHANLFVSDIYDDVDLDDRAPPPESPLTHPKYHFITNPNSQPGQKYYVVFVGKCVGIFTFWPYVKSLTEGLKGVATFKGFDSFQIAAENYNKAKSIGVVRIMRLQGDDFRYGPKSEGMQDAIDTILL